MSRRLSRQHLVAGLRSEPLIVGAMAVLAALVLVGLIVPALARNYVDPQLLRIHRAPSWLGGVDGGLFGTDDLGRDLFARMAAGLRKSIEVGFLSVALGGLLGGAAGVLAGYLGGRVDAAIMRVADIQSAFPSLLIIIAIIGVSGGSQRTIVLFLGLEQWTLYARIMRGRTLPYRTSDLVLGTVGLGGRTGRIVLRHVVPNILDSLLAVSTVAFARVVLAEAGLSYLGYGISPPDVSLGAILASGQQYIQTSWWIALFPGIFLVLLILTANLIGSWLNRVIDPLHR